MLYDVVKPSMGTRVETLGSDPAPGGFVSIQNELPTIFQKAMSGLLCASAWPGNSQDILGGTLCVLIYIVLNNVQSKGIIEKVDRELDQ